MAIQTIKATIQMRNGLEQDFDGDQMIAGEWAVSTDKKYVRMCFAPGIVVRMATYEGFEQDMLEIQTILATCENIQAAVDIMAEMAERHKNEAADYSLLSESWAHGNTGVREGEDTDNSEYHSLRAKKQADRAKTEADRASAIAGFNIDSELSEISENPVQNKVITKALKESKVDLSVATVEFQPAEKRDGIESGDKIPVLFGKLKKWLDDLSETAFDGIALKWRTARNINGMSVDGSENRMNYGTCSTASATAGKTVDCKGFSLVTGAEIVVKFMVTNSAASPTLNVNGTGAKPIFYRGAAIIAGYLAAGRTYGFRYNGAQYDLVGDIDTDVRYNNMSPATASAAGRAGLVPTPGAGKQNGYLRGDATWVTPTANLLATEPGIPLDQTMGKVLKDDIDALNSKLTVKSKAFTSSYITSGVIVKVRSGIAYVNMNVPLVSTLSNNDVLATINDSNYQGNVWVIGILEYDGQTNVVQYDTNNHTLKFIGTQIPAGAWVTIILMYFTKM